MNEQRHEQAAALRKEKKTFREIGVALGVAPHRAREIVLKAERMARQEPCWTVGLSSRTGYALRRAGFESREQLQAAAIKGKLVVGAYYEIGKIAIAEVMVWLGLLAAADYKPKPPVRAVAIQRAIALLEANGYLVEKASIV